jgi:uncharacterized membrane protein
VSRGRAPDGAESTSALIHLYRGELGRMTAYRARLDATTDWAVGATAAITSFTLGDPAVPHFVLLLGAALVGAFLWMETRRFRFYELVRGRVRLLETGFYGEVLGGPAPEWRGALRASLAHPTPPVTAMQAMSHRLRRNYLWLVLVLYAAWGLKLGIHRNGGSFVAAAHVGPVPGGAVVGVALAVLIALVVLSRTYRPDEQE